MSSQVGIFRSNITPVDRLITTTVGRKHMLDDLIEKLANNARKKGGQHYLFIGPRGIGKTHFLSLIKQGVTNNTQLTKDYTVLRFPEENNRLLSFADFLLGVIEILGEVLDDKEWKGLYQSLSTMQNDMDIIDAAIPRLKKYQTQTDKTLLILIENLDTVFTSQIKREQDIHKFRSFLMDSPCATLIGTSPVYFPALYNSKSPLYEFFDIQVLEDLAEDQTINMIRKNLEWEKCEEILNNFNSVIPKIQALHTMTGGNPRLIMMLYELIAHNNLLDVKHQFQKLLDQISPFYQDRLKDLAPQERALLETIALMRTKPRTPANIAEKFRKSQQQTSSLLKRMTKAGYLTVSDNPSDKRSKLYRIKEGFFDLWLAMSESRAQRKRLSYLVEFFEIYYSDLKEREEKRNELWQLLKEDVKSEKTKEENNEELLGYLSEVGDKDEQVQTKLELAVHNIKKGNSSEAKQFLKESGSEFSNKPSFTWMTEQTHQWADKGIELNVRKWLDDMIAYWRLQRSGDLEKAVEIARKLSNDISGRGLHNIRIELLQDVLQQTSSSKEKADIYLEIARSEEMVGQLDEALKSLQNAYNLYQKINDKNGEGTTLNNIGKVYDFRGDYGTALQYLKQSLKISQEISNKIGKGITLNNISQIYSARGDYGTALQYLEQSLKISQELGEKKEEGTVLNNISQIYHARGDHDTALQYLENSLKIRQEIGDKNGEGTTLNNLATTACARGNYDTAIKYLEQSLIISQEVDNKNHEATTLNNISQIYSDRGDYNTALQYLKNSLKIRQEIGNKNHEATTLNNISIIYHARGDYDKALQYLEQSLKINQEIGDKKGECTILNNISQNYHARGDYNTALRHLENSLKISQEIGSKSAMIPILHNMASITQKNKDYEKNFEYESQAYQLAVETGNAMGLFHTGQQFGQRLYEMEKKDEGIKILKQCYQIGKKGKFQGIKEVEKILSKWGALE